MKYGLTQTAIEKICTVFAGVPEIEKAVLYGSRAKGNFKPGSDIDLTLFGENLNPSQSGDIAEALDDLLLPYTIDLSLYAELNHAKLREHIDRVGVVFYKRGSAGQHQGAAMKKGWQMKTLGDVCTFDKVQGIHRGLPYVGLEHIESHTARFIGSTEPQPVKSSTFRFSNEHALYGRLRPYLNKALAPDFEGHCSTEIFPLKPTRELSREYLLYWLLSDETCERINATCTGARMPRAQMNEVLGFEFPLPPLPEQQRIVGILDEAFEGLATAKANAEKNLQNARALFESHLHVEHAEKAMLGDLVNIKTGKLDANAAVEGGKFPFFTCSRDIFAIDTYAFDCEAILLAGNNAVGDFNVKHYNGKFNAYQRTYVITVNEKKRVLCRFLYFQMLKSLKKFKAQSVGAGTKFLKLGMIKELEIELPSLDEQQRIVSTMDAVREETQRLARLYERKLAALEALKKSLLHQAFTGAL